MSRIRDSLSRLFTPVQKLPPGIYHYQAPQDDPRNYRLHLRLEEDGGGVLIVNASTLLHLNQTAAEYAYYLVHNVPVEEVTRKMTERYRVDPEQAREDYQNLIDRIQVFVATTDLDPVTFLDFDRQLPFSGQISAPYRLDCALTYNLPDGGAPEAAPADRVKQELTSVEWKLVLDKSWAAGIPHVVFTGGEPTLRTDLPELIAHAEGNGQVTGLLTDGLRLAEKLFLDKLMLTGLDHLMLILQPENELAWKALQNCLGDDLFVAVHLTITESNQEEIPPLIKRLAEMGVKAISLSAPNPGVTDALTAARDQVASLDLELVWNLPVPYSAHNPVALETNHMGDLQGAGRAWLYVEPDGDVLPTQGSPTVLGNILRDPWEKIWK